MEEAFANGVHDNPSQELRRLSIRLAREAHSICCSKIASENEHRGLLQHDIQSNGCDLISPPFRIMDSMIGNDVSSASAI